MNVEQYLANYVARRRAVMVIAAVSSALAFSIGWTLLCCLLDSWLQLAASIRVSLTVAAWAGVIAIIARPGWILFQRYDPVKAAVEIENSLPQFDQRLITVASPQPAVPLITHLMAEVETILADRTNRARVSLKPLVIPVSALIIIIALLCGMNRWSTIDWPHSIDRLYHPSTVH